MDLEWNQASDLKTKLENELMFEIIEIGAVKLDENRNPVDSFHELIRPQVFHKMHQITGELVHIKMNQLKNCRLFEDVVNDFFKWCGDDYIFCTWGNLDLLELQRNLDYFNIPPISNGPLKFYDLQKLFSIAFEDKKIRRNLEFAIDYLDIDKSVAFHRADSDAFYTAKVMQKINDPEIYENVSYDTYHIPKSKKNEIKVQFKDYEKYISKGYEDRVAALEDNDITRIRCYFCNKNIRKKIDWFTTNNGKHYISVGLCEKHGYFKAKIRMKKDKDDKVYVIKTNKQITPEEFDEIKKKKSQNKKSSLQK